MKRYLFQSYLFLPFIITAMYSHHFVVMGVLISALAIYALGTVVQYWHPQGDVRVRERIENETNSMTEEQIDQQTVKRAGKVNYQKQDFQPYQANRSHPARSKGQR